MEVADLLRNVQVSGVECIVPVLPGIGNLENLLQEATHRSLRLAGVPARCITIMPPLPCGECDLLAFARAYCFCEQVGASKGDVRKVLFDALDGPSSTVAAFHPVDALMRILHLFVNAIKANDVEFRLLTQSIALLQLAEVSRVAQQLRHDWLHGLCDTGVKAIQTVLSGKPVQSSDAPHDRSSTKVVLQSSDEDSEDNAGDGEEHVDDGDEQSQPRFLHEADFEIVNKSGIFFEDAENGQGPIAAIFLKGALSSEVCSNATIVLDHVATTQNLRKALNGGAVPPHTGIVGFYDYINNATSRKCRETQFTRRNWPEIAKDAAPLVQQLDSIYREHAPYHYRQQRMAIPERFQLFDSVFSTITVNRNFRTAAHTDRGDFKSGLGIVAVLDGNFEGCHLGIPKLKRAFELKPGDVLLFNTSLEHGNTEVHSLEGMWRRVSIVAYFRTGLISQTCLEQEQRRVRSILSRLPTSCESSVVDINTELRFQPGPLYVPTKVLPLLTQVQLSAVIFASERISNNTGCILGMSMGLGKTLVALLLAHSHTSQNLQDDVLIVTPKTIIPHWHEEIQKWNKIANFSLQSVVISSDMSQIEFDDAVLQYQYQCLGKLSKVGHYFILNPEAVGGFVKRCQQFNPALIFLDEGHRVSAKQSKLKELLSQLSSRKRIVLSGTPVQNHSEELYRLIEWVSPEVAMTLSRETYCDFAAHVDAFVDSDSVDGQLDDTFESAARAQRFLMDWQRGFVLRCIDLELPRLTELLVVCGSSSWQKDQRKLFNLEGSSSLLQACEHRTHHLSAHPLCLVGFIGGMWAKGLEGESGPAFYPRDVEQCEYWMRRLNEDPVSAVPDVVALSGKTLALVNIVAFCRGRSEKVVVFSQYVGVQELIYRLLQSAGFNPLLLRGRDTLDVRKKSIRRFAAAPCDQCCVLIVSTKVGAFGVDLTTANNVVLFDSWWNPQVDAQAVARCYRRNQLRSVTVFRLATFFDDGAVIRSQQRKLALFQSLVDGKLSQTGARFNVEDARGVVDDDDAERSSSLWHSLMEKKLLSDGDQAVLAVIRQPSPTR